MYKNCLWERSFICLNQIIPHHHTGDQTFSLLLCETKVYKLCMTDQIHAGLAILLSEQRQQCDRSFGSVPCSDVWTVHSATELRLSFLHFVHRTFRVTGSMFVHTKPSESSEGVSKEGKKRKQKRCHSAPIQLRAVSSGLKWECFEVVKYHGCPCKDNRRTHPINIIGTFLWQVRRWPSSDLNIPDRQAVI